LWQAATIRLAASASGSMVSGFTNSMAIMAPRPRMSPIPAWDDWSDVKRSAMVAPILTAAPARSWSTMVWIEASAATHDTGLPP